MAHPAGAPDGEQGCRVACLRPATLGGVTACVGWFRWVSTGSETKPIRSRPAGRHEPHTTTSRHRPDHNTNRNAPRGPPHPGTLSRRTRRHRPPGCDTPEPNHQHQPPPTNEPQPPRNTPRQHPDNETNPRRPTERSEVLLGLPPGVAGTFVPAVADARSVRSWWWEAGAAVAVRSPGLPTLVDRASDFGQLPPTNNEMRMAAVGKTMNGAIETSIAWTFAGGLRAPSFFASARMLKDR